MDRWLHFSETGGDPWVLPIWRQINDAVEHGRAAPISSGLRETGVHISTRLNFLPHIVQRINVGVRKLNRLAERRARRNEFSAGQPGYALAVDNDLKYELLIDVNSLLFELKALCEQLSEFFRLVHDHSGIPMPLRTASASMRHIQETEGHDATWIDRLTEYRNYFTHRGAPYLAMDISTARYDVLLLKRNVIDLAASTSFVRLSDINRTVQGFRAQKQLIRQHLSRLFA